MKFKKSSKKGKADNEGVIVGSNSSFRPTKKMFLALAVILIVVAVGLIVLLRARSDNTVDQANRACVNEEGLLDEARQLFSYDELDELRVMADRIQTLEKFEQDPNCLFVLVKFNVLSNNAGDARQHLEKYKAVYDTEAGLDPALGESPATLDELEQEVEATEQFRQELEGSSFYSNGSPEGEATQ